MKITGTDFHNSKVEAYITWNSNKWGVVSILSAPKPTTMAFLLLGGTLVLKKRKNKLV